MGVMYLFPHRRFRVHAPRAHIPRSDHLGSCMLNYLYLSCNSRHLFMASLRSIVNVEAPYRRHCPGWRDESTAIPYQQPSDTLSGRAREPWPRRVALQGCRGVLVRHWPSEARERCEASHVFRALSSYNYSIHIKKKSRCRLRAEHSSSAEGKSIFIQIKRSNPLPHLSSSTSA